MSFYNIDILRQAAIYRSQQSENNGAVKQQFPDSDKFLEEPLGGSYVNGQSPSLSKAQFSSLVPNWETKIKPEAENGSPVTKINRPGAIDGAMSARSSSSDVKVEYSVPRAFTPVSEKLAIYARMDMNMSGAAGV